MLNPVYSSQTYQKQVALVTHKTMAECRFMHTDDLDEIVAVVPQIASSNAVIGDGKACYRGKIVCTVVYTTQDKKFCRMQKGVEFEGEVQDDAFVPAQTAQLCCTVTDYRIKHEGSYHTVVVTIAARVHAFSACQRTYLTAAEGVATQIKPVTFCTALPFTGEGEVEDEFDADSVEDVLLPACNAVVSSCRCDGAEAVVRGELCLSVLALRAGSPVGFDRNVPFQLAIPCPDVALPTEAQCFVEVKELTVTATVNEDKRKCRLAVNISLGVNGICYEEQTLPVVTDAFGLTHELTIETEEQPTHHVADRFIRQERVGGACTTKAPLTEQCLLKAVALPQVEAAYNAATGTIDGEITATLLCERDEHGFGTQLCLPFSLSVDGDENTDYAVCAYGVMVHRRQDGALEAEANVKLSVVVHEQTRSSYIVNVEEGAPIAPCQDVVTVVFPCKGDTLWDVARRYHFSPEAIEQATNGAPYPYRGDERFLIYHPIES